MRTVSVSLAATMRALNDAGQLHSTVAQNLLQARKKERKMPKGDAVKTAWKRHVRYAARGVCLCARGGQREHEKVPATVNENS